MVKIMNLIGIYRRADLMASDFKISPGIRFLLKKRMKSTKF
jgi:hypothetical protein